MYDITLIPGDGIGREVTDSMKAVVKAAGIDVNWEEVIAGSEAIDKYGSPLPDEVIDSIKKNKIAIKGPITTPIGTGFRSVNVGLRKTLNLYANVRPIKSFKGIKSRYDGVNLTIIRENTEGLYSGVEHKIGDEAGESIKIITKKATHNIVNFAVNYLKNSDYNKLTCVHKANIMKISDGLFLEEYRKIIDNSFEIINLDEDVKEDKYNYKLNGKEYIIDDMIVDATAMNMALDPTQFGVMVMPNLYGDILSDLGAGLVGGLGLIASANIGEEYAVFEAVHGSAPQIAGKNIANPTAIIQSAVMMLRYIKEYNAADKIEKSLEEIFEEGKILTADLGGNASTEEFTKELIKKITS